MLVTEGPRSIPSYGLKESVLPDIKTGNSLMSIQPTLCIKQH